MKLPVLQTNLMQMVLVIFGICPDNVCLGWCYNNDPKFNSFYFGLMKSHGDSQPFGMGKCRKHVFNQAGFRMEVRAKNLPTLYTSVP